MKTIKILLITLSFLFLVSCNSPAEKVEETQSRIQKTELGIRASNDKLVQQAHGFIATAQSVTKTLDEGKAKSALNATLNRADGLLNEAGYSLTLSQKTEFEMLAENLMSDSEMKNKIAQDQIKQKDKQIEVVINDLNQSKSELEKLKKKYDEEVRDVIADSVLKDQKIAEQKEKLGFWATVTRVGKWLSVAAGAAFLLPLLTPLFPALAPIFMGVGKAVGWIIGAVLKLPGALSGASVVVKQQYDQLKQVATDHIIAQEDIRKELKEKGSISKEKHDQLLKEYITEADGTASVVDSIRRENLLIK